MPKSKEMEVSVCIKGWAESATLGRIGLSQYYKIPSPRYLIFQTTIGPSSMNQAATIIFAKMVEFACLNPQEQPSAFANRVSPGTTATPRCRRVQKIRASMTLIAQKILPVAQVMLITCFHDS